MQQRQRKRGKTLPKKTPVNPYRQNTPGMIKLTRFKNQSVVRSLVVSMLTPFNLQYGCQY
jgi:hypothetical protein